MPDQSLPNVDAVNRADTNVRRMRRARAVRAFVPVRGDSLAASTWEYIPVAPRATRRAVPMPSADVLAASAQYAALTPYVAPDVFDPARPTRAHADLERAATRFLRDASAAAGCPACRGDDGGEHDYDVCLYIPSPDTFDRWANRVHVRPDAVAFRGTVRVRPVSPVRVFSPFVTRNGERVQTFDTDPVTGAWLLHVRDVAASDASTVRGWRGHKRYAVPRRAARARAASTRQAARRAAGATSTRGPAVSPFAWHTGTLRRRWAAVARGTADGAADVVARAADIDAVLRTSADGARVTFYAPDGAPVATVDVIDVGTRVRGDDGRVFPIGEWARRAALAGADGRSQ